MKQCKNPRWAQFWPIASALVLNSCLLDVAEACAPVEDRIGFFSQGDCAFSNAPFFRGHEWISYFGNQQLSSADQFNDAEVQQMATGNRRVDYPKELLIHLDNGILAYTSALFEYTDRAEVQPMHFLLNDTNTEREAAQAAREQILATTVEALSLWNRERGRALTLIGQAHHTLQDSFSPAHTVRRQDPDLYGLSFDEAVQFLDSAEGRARNDLPLGGRELEPDVVPCIGECSCIQRVKAFMPRAEGHQEGVLFHGSDGDDNSGHLTTQDSIYRVGRDCHEPDTAAEVRSCLDEHARQAVQATAAYLRLVRRLVRDGIIEQEATQQSVQEEFDAFSRAHLSFCDASEPELD